MGHEMCRMGRDIVTTATTESAKITADFFS